MFKNNWVFFLSPEAITDQNLRSAGLGVGMCTGMEGGGRGYLTREVQVSADGPGLAHSHLNGPGKMLSALCVCRDTKTLQSS